MAKLYFYYSAMNAGKSTALLQASYNYQERGMKTLLFVPAIDDRYTVGEIHSRIGLNAQATIFNAQDNLYDITHQTMQSGTLACVLVDEAQFLTKKQVLQLTAIADKLSIAVLTYGLRSDYMGEPFEGSKYLLVMAEEISELKTICFCGKKATMNVRIDANGHRVSQGKQVHIGGNDSYISTCRYHFSNGKLPSEL